MSPNISRSHNDIFNFRSSLLIMALMQISGAVMSLAKGWEEVFEKQTATTTPSTASCWLSTRRPCRRHADAGGRKLVDVANDQKGGFVGHCLHERLKPPVLGLTSSSRWMVSKTKTIWPRTRSRVPD